VIDAEDRIRSFHADRGWRADVCAYLGVAEAELDAGADAPPPQSSPARVRAAREIARLEAMARADYKLALHREWLDALARKVVPGRELCVLDYGSGAGGFAALALGWPEVRVRLAETSDLLLGYLRWKALRRRDGRCDVVALPARAGRNGRTARLRVEVGAVTGGFDALVLADVLEHTLDPLRVLIHLLARLRPQGLAFVNYPSEIDGDWHTPEAFYQRAACYRLLRACCAHAGGHVWRRRGGALPGIALALARLVEPWLRLVSRRFARRVFAERGASIVARVREHAGRELRVEDLVADV
jgi:SAM-dependent methyltransferase